MADRLRRDARENAVGYAVNTVVTAVGGTAGTLLARRYPKPGGVVPEPRWVLLGGPLLVAVLSVAGSRAWDAALGAAVAIGASAALLAADRPAR